MNEQSSDPIEGTQQGQELGNQETGTSDIPPATNGQSDLGSNVEDGNNSVDWTKDSRYASHWKGDNGTGDPNKVYESLKYMESRQSDYDNQKNDYSKLQSKFDTVQNDYQDLQSYNNNVKKIMDDPVLGNQIRDVISQHSNNEVRSRYGSNLDDGQVGAIANLETRLQETEKWQKSYQSDMNLKEQQNLAMDSMDQIREWAKENEINWTSEDQESFINHCDEKGVPVANLKAEFIMNSLPQIKKNAHLNGENSARKNISAGSEASLGQPLNGASLGGSSNAPQTISSVVNSILGSP